jgi:hypothetical protein
MRVRLWVSRDLVSGLVYCPGAVVRVALILRQICNPLTRDPPGCAGELGLGFAYEQMSPLILGKGFSDFATHI